MGRTFALAAACSLLLVSAASADIALPEDLKYVDPRVRFEGIDAHADHVFYLRYRTFSTGPGRGVPYTMVKVKDSNAFRIEAGRWLVDMELLALDRKEFEKRAKDDPSLKWLTDKTEGVLRARVDEPSNMASVNSKGAPLTIYRVSIEDGKLKAEMVEVQKSGRTAPTGPWPSVAFGSVSAMSLAWFGVWFARRGRLPSQRRQRS
jgi:hypothetical protein